MTNYEYIINEMSLKEFYEKFGNSFMYRLQEKIRWHASEQFFGCLFTGRQGFVDCLISLLPSSGNSTSDFADVFWVDIIKNYEKDFDWSSYEPWDRHWIREGSCKGEAQRWLESEKGGAKVK